MGSRPAIVLVVLIVAGIAFCFAGVFAAMTGTYHINFDLGNNTTDGGIFGNITGSDSDKPSSSSQNSVQTYSDDSPSSSSSQSSEPADEPSTPSSEPSEPKDSGDQPQNPAG